MAKLFLIIAFLLACIGIWLIVGLNKMTKKAGMSMKPEKGPEL